MLRLYWLPPSQDNRNEKKKEIRWEKRERCYQTGHSFQTEHDQPPHPFRLTDHHAPCTWTFGLCMSPGIGELLLDALLPFLLAPMSPVLYLTSSWYMEGKDTIPHLGVYYYLGHFQAV